MCLSSLLRVSTIVSPLFRSSLPLNREETKTVDPKTAPCKWHPTKQAVALDRTMFHLCSNLKAREKQKGKKEKKQTVMVFEKHWSNKRCQ